MTVSAVNVADSNQQHARTLLWENINSGDLDGDWIELPDHADASMQVIGTFGTATLVFQGSNDGVTPATLTDPAGNELSFTAAALKQIVEVCRFVRPLASGADGTTDLDVYLHARQNR